MPEGHCKEVPSRKLDAGVEPKRHIRVEAEVGNHQRIASGETEGAGWKCGQPGEAV